MFNNYSKANNLTSRRHLVKHTPQIAGKMTRLIRVTQGRIYALIPSLFLISFFDSDSVHFRLRC